MHPYTSDPQGAPPPAIYLRTPGDTPPFRPVLDGLVELFDLRVYGNSGLNGCARTALRRGAVLLAAAFVFDLLAWSMLFTLILHGGNFALTLRTTLALGLAVLLSIATLVFETSLFTADISRWTWRKALSWCGRVVLIGVFAVLTAQPIHSLLFDGPIERRAQQEQALEQAFLIAHDIVEKRRDAEALRSGGKATGFERLIADLEAEVSKIEMKKAELLESTLAATSDRGAATSAQASAKDRIAYYKRKITAGGEPADLKKWQSLQQRATVDATEATSTIAGLDAELQRLADEGTSIDQRLEELRKERSTLRTEERTDVDNRVATEDIEVRRLRRYVSEIYTGTPGEPVAVEGLDRTFTARPYDFFERLRVLDDLCDGRPPRWPTGDLEEAELAVLTDELKLSFVEPDGDATAAEVASWARSAEDLRRQAVGLNLIWWVTQVIGMFIPLLTILYKLMLPLDLKLYYATKWQRRIGNPETRLLDDGEAQDEEEGTTRYLSFDPAVQPALTPLQTSGAPEPPLAQPLAPDEPVLTWPSAPATPIAHP